MHPEITSDVPGRCPKCGMALVLQESRPRIHVASGVTAVEAITWRSYIPLAVIVGLITAASLVTSSSLNSFVILFMAGFFIVFGGFKLIDLNGFVEGYSTYDLIASRSKSYAYAYPFIELAFGFSMLVGFHPDWLLIIEAVVMGVSGVGVLIKLLKREPFMCVCLGTVLKVPLTYVTLVEDFGMVILALYLLAV